MALLELVTTEPVTTIVGLLVLALDNLITTGAAAVLPKEAPIQMVLALLGSTLTAVFPGAHGGNSNGNCGRCTIESGDTIIFTGIIPRIKNFTIIIKVTGVDKLSAVIIDRTAQ